MQDFTPFRGKKRDAMAQDRRETSDLGHKRKWCHARVMSVLPVQDGAVVMDDLVLTEA
jgi:hypothetical protein